MRAMVLAAQELTGTLGRPSQHDLFAAREMQALSFVFHIPLVCFGIAFPAIVLFVEGLWLRTGEPAYRDLARRWSKAMVVLFAVGVVTGTILSFELGLLWPNFMATFGSVFGLAFGIEGFAFFTEAIFIAMYVYGWDRLGRRTHLAVGLPIVAAGVVGSLMVISVNGWMNHPTGFTVAGNAVTDVHPWAALFNSHLPYELLHMYLAGYMVAGFLVAAVYARAWLRGRRDRYVRAALVVPLTVAALAAPAQVVVGDWAGRMVARDQAPKLAAMEGMGRTERHAALHLGGIYENGDLRYSVAIPGLLSLLAYHDANAPVRGLDAVPPADRPPVNVVHLSFEAMVAIGMALAVLGLGYLVVAARGRLPRSPWFFRAVMAAGPLAVIALMAGWVTTEVGRQPWIAWGVMRTSDAVTQASGLPVAYGVLALVYLGLIVVVVWLLRRLARRPADVEAPPRDRVAAAAR
jgi:cytochrome d ubiquinol oxidase subunit I